MWVDWLHNPCRLGGPQRFRAGDKIRKGRMGNITTTILGGSPTLQSGGQNQKWPTCGRIGYMRSSVLRSFFLVNGVNSIVLFLRFFFGRPLYLGRFGSIILVPLKRTRGILDSGSAVHSYTQLDFWIDGVEDMGDVWAYEVWNMFQSCCCKVVHG